MAHWPIQDAKAHFSEIIERAHSEGPQVITRHGAECAVLLSIEDYHSLTGKKPNLESCLLGGPIVDDFSIERDRDTGREVEMEDSLIPVSGNCG